MKEEDNIGKPRAPVVTERVLYCGTGYGAGEIRNEFDTHSIIITLHDGEPVSIKIEQIK